jgi:hypothetical protein
MNLKDMLIKTKDDVDTFNQVAKADIRINEHLLAMVAKWFNDVELNLPIAEMPMDEDERKALTVQITDEMIGALDTALAALAREADEDIVLTKAAEDLDPLWRELAGLQARILNDIYRRNTTPETKAEVLEALSNMIEHLVEMTGEDETKIRERVLKDAGVRRLLKRMGIEPDSI